MAKGIAHKHKGWTKKNNEVYQGLDCLIKELALETATKVGQQMYGYIQSRALTLCGKFLIIYKMVLDYKIRGQSPMGALEWWPVMSQVFMSTCIAEGDVALEVVNMNEVGSNIQGMSEIKYP